VLPRDVLTISAKAHLPGPPRGQALRVRSVTQSNLGQADGSAPLRNPGGGRRIGTPVSPGGGHARAAAPVPAPPLSSQWRWRESNPRPSTPSQGFSGRSLLCFSQPRRSRRRVADGLSHCLFSRSAPWPDRSVEPSSDARSRAEGTPGLTEVRYLRSEGQGVLAHLSVLVIGTCCLRSQC